MTDLITDPDAIDFTHWVSLAATLSRLDPELHSDRMVQAGFEPTAFSEAESRHLRAMGRATSRGDRTLAERYAAEMAPTKDALEHHSPSSEHLMTTSDGEPGGPPSLPFSNVRSPAFDAQLREMREDVGPASDAGATLDPAPRTKEDTLPFGSHRNLDLLRIESYAEFSASYEAAPDKASVMESFQIRDAEQLTALERYWQRRFSAEPWLKSQFEVLVQRHRRSG